MADKKKLTGKQKKQRVVVFIILGGLIIGAVAPLAQLLFL